MESTPLVELNDAVLAEAWAAGDERAFEQIVARHTPRIFNRCRLALGATDADDATQAVFLVLARKGGQAAASPILVAWLMQVAGNVVRNAVRDRGRRRDAERQAPPPPTAGEPTMSDLAGHLDACLAEIPTAEREAVTLHHLAGCTLAEVGAQTGAGISTVHARVQRGLERLRALLAQRGVALSSLALAAALASEAQAAVPAEVMFHLRDLTPAGGGTGSTTVSFDRARRWSHQGLSTMSHLAIAAAGLLTIVSAAWQFLPSAEAKPSEAKTPHLIAPTRSSTIASGLPDGNASNNEAAEITRIEMLDVQGLFGGNDLVLKNDDKIIVATVKGGNAVVIKTAIKFKEVIRQLPTESLLNYVEKKRLGVPDESHPKIILYFGDGSKREFFKWANDEDQNFDQFYKKLLALCKNTKGEVIYNGKYDWKLRE